MKILSLFDGISCCRVALNRADIPVDTYYASEIDKYAITVAQKNFPGTIQLGDVTKWKSWDIDFASIDIVTAGFPCQAWSVAGKQLGDRDERGALFWTTLDIISHIKKLNPKVIFMLENVKMKREFEEYISHHTEQALGRVNKYLINSALVSAQNRQRYYWTNIEGVKQPEDRGILLRDIIEDGEVDRNKSHCLDASYFKGGNLKSYFEKHRRQLVFKEKSQTILATIYKENAKSMIKRNKSGLLVFNYSSSGRGSGVVEGRFSDAEKALTLTATGYSNRSLSAVMQDFDDFKWRKLTPLECERLQTLPDNYTAGISDTQRYKCLGNGWTVDVIAHIFKNIT
jgi:DNA-cytosine methyltransferase